MSKRDHIRAIDAGSSRNASKSDQDRDRTAGDEKPAPDGAKPEWRERLEELDQEETTSSSPSFARRLIGRIPAFLALVAAAGWTALLASANWSALVSGASASQWIDWIVAWSVPIVLIIGLWLLAMRNSTQEARRFAQIAGSLSQESRRLEERLHNANRELSLAREFLAAQSRELESLGRIAAEKLSTHAGELQALIADNGAQVDQIASVSESAMNNMRKLRDDLPVIATSARDVSNQIGQSGRTAQEQIEKLIAAFARLNDFGTASDAQVEKIVTRFKAAIASFDDRLTQIAGASETRFSALSDQAEHHRVQLETREVEALAAMRQRADNLEQTISELRKQIEETEQQSLDRFHAVQERMQQSLLELIDKIDRLDAQAVASSRKRIEELTEEAERFDERLAARDLKFNEEIRRRQDQFETRESQASALLEQRLAALDEMLSQKSQAQLELAQQIEARSERIGRQAEQFKHLIAEIEETSLRSDEALAASFAALGDRLDGHRKTIGETGEAVSSVTEAAVRLLEILQASATQTREELPSAIDQANAALEQLEGRTTLVGTVVREASERGDALGAAIETTIEQIAQAQAALKQSYGECEQLDEEALAKLQGLRGLLRTLRDELVETTDAQFDRLASATRQIEEATRQSLALLEERATTELTEAAQSLGDRAVEALARRLKLSEAETIGQLEQAAAHAAGVGRETAIQLRDQLAKINELALNLEQRVARAKEQAQEQLDNDFARRMALITDSLNSNAIDISRALTQDIPDTAWSAYLKGDRGIFTRRAVRLLEANEAREVVEHYQSDKSFRDHVNRYIHDFEAMLRSLLSTRDGNALGVTILSSDMGKLYVALAQAIERLRT